MKCPDCRVLMTAEDGVHTCPDCGAVVVLRDAGYSPLLAPEPERLLFRPTPAQAVFDAIDAPAAEPAPDDATPDVCPPDVVAALHAELNAQGVGRPNRYPPKRCGLASCATWFIPLSGNARYCKTQSPLCNDIALAQNRRDNRASRRVRRGFRGAEFGGRAQ